MDLSHHGNWYGLLRNGDKLAAYWCNFPRMAFRSMRAHILRGYDRVGFYVRLGKEKRMIIETATVWALSALLLMTIIIAVYFAIFFMIFYAIGWGLARFLKPIARLLYFDI